jgi:hypothetical protein
MAREQRSEVFPEGGIGRRTYLRGVGVLATLGGASVAVQNAGAGSNTLSVVGTAGDVTNYELAVSGSLRSVSAPTAVSPGRAAEDALGDDTHRFEFEGELTSVRLDGPGAVFVNGEPVALD